MRRGGRGRERSVGGWRGGCGGEDVERVGCRRRGLRARRWWWCGVEAGSYLLDGVMPTVTGSSRPIQVSSNLQAPLHLPLPLATLSPPHLYVYPPPAHPPPPPPLPATTPPSLLQSQTPETPNPRNRTRPALQVQSPYSSPHPRW